MQSQSQNMEYQTDNRRNEEEGPNEVLPEHTFDTEQELVLELVEPSRFLLDYDRGVKEYNCAHRNQIELQNQYYNSGR